MIIKIHDKNHFLVGCNDKELLESMQYVMDGKKVRLKYQILIPLRAGPKIYRFKQYGITWGPGVKELMAQLLENIKKRKAVIKKIRSQYGGDIKFDYNYRGKYPKVLEHQKIMYNVMAYSDIGAILADPGTCKTAPYLWAIDKRIERGQVKRALVVTLSTLKTNVMEELEAQAPHMKAVILKTKAQANKVLNKTYKSEKKNIDYQIYISNFESMFSMVDLFPDDYFQMIILDEAHRIGSHVSRQTKEIVKKFEFAKYKYLITGTLHANNMMSFYMPFRFMGPDTIPYAKFVEFRRRYMFAVDPDQRIWKEAPGSRQVVKEIVGNLSVVFKKEDCLDLPPIIRQKLYCKMGKDQEIIHKKMAKTMIAEIEEMKLGCTRPNCCDGSCENTLVAKNALVLRRKLHQLESGFYIDTDTIIDESGKETNNSRIIKFPTNPKLSLLVQTLNNIPSERKVIIWTSYVYLIEAISERLSKAFGPSSYLTCYKGQDAYNQVQLFKNPSIPYMVANPTKMGVGQNMQFSNYQIFFNNNDSYVQREQAEGRQHREGQKEKVTIIDFVSEGFVDAAILKSLIAKEDMSMSLSELARVAKLVKYG